MILFLNFLQVHPKCILLFTVNIISSVIGYISFNLKFHPAMNKDLASFNYDDSETMEMLFEIIEETSFRGVSVIAK